MGVTGADVFGAGSTHVEAHKDILEEGYPVESPRRAAPKWWVRGLLPRMWPGGSDDWRPLGKRAGGSEGTPGNTLGSGLQRPSLHQGFKAIYRQVLELWPTIVNTDAYVEKQLFQVDLAGVARESD
jgi:hypothetical protein